MPRRVSRQLAATKRARDLAQFGAKHKRARAERAAAQRVRELQAQPGRVRSSSGSHRSARRNADCAADTRGGVRPRFRRRSANSRAPSCAGRGTARAAAARKRRARPRRKRAISRCTSMSASLVERESRAASRRRRLDCSAPVVLPTAAQGSRSRAASVPCGAPAGVRLRRRGDSAARDSFAARRSGHSRRSRRRADRTSRSLRDGCNIRRVSARARTRSHARAAPIGTRRAQARSCTSRTRAERAEVVFGARSITVARTSSARDSRRSASQEHPECCLADSAAQIL